LQGSIKNASREQCAKLHYFSAVLVNWGLRDYGTGQWEGGEAECDHTTTRRNHGDEKQSTSNGTSRDSLAGLTECRNCGARRIDSQLGLEATPEEYIANMVALFREVWRVLRDDGTCWINLGSSFASSNTNPSQFPLSSRALACDSELAEDRTFVTPGFL
jgi:hypothetical protein